MTAEAAANPAERRMKLSRPITKGDNKLTELVFREPLAGDLIDANAKSDSTTERTVLLVMAMTGLSKAEVRSMTAKDYVKATTIIDDFLVDGPETGSA